MVNLIGISGKMGSGKDEVGETIQSLSKTKGTSRREDGISLPVYQIKKFAYKVKEVAALFTGIDVEIFEDQEFKSKPLGKEWLFDEHTLTGRELLQKIGTEVGRSIHPETWINALFSDYTLELRRVPNINGGTTIADGYPNWIITDVRFPNEADAIRARGGVVIRVNRPTVVIDQHASEISLDDYNKFDYIIENTGSLDDLHRNVEEMYRNLG